MRFCLIALALTLFIAEAEAQALRAGTVHVGVSGGVNNAYIINQNNYGRPELDYKIGVDAGFALKAGYQVTSSVGVRAGLLYTRQGQAYEDGSTEKDADLRYLGLPLLADVRLGDASKGFYFQIGPQLSLLLGADVTRNGETLAVDGRTDEDLYRGTDVGVLFELGPYIGLTRRSYATLGLRGLYGLTDINADDPAVRVPNAEGEAYEGSRNAYAGVHLTLHYVFGQR